MAEKLTREEIADLATVHVALPVLPRLPAPRILHGTRVDRSFELPPVLYAATVGLFLGFLAVMAIGFPHPEMILPMAIFTLFIVAGFGVPTIWATMKPDSGQKAISWRRFQAEGIMTATGRTAAPAATVQVLILPALIFLWGVAAAVIAAVVR